MGIRKHNKDHVIPTDVDTQRELHPIALANSDANVDEVQIDFNEAANTPLVFWTSHEKRTIVDLRRFAGEDKLDRSPKIGFKPITVLPRPTLIHQLAPILKQVLQYAAPTTVENMLGSLLQWWSLFDRIEAAPLANYAAQLVVSSVTDLTAIHRQAAFDNNMHSSFFSPFVRIVDIWLVANNYSPLYWTPPQRPDPKRFLPPQWQIDEYRFELKHRWFASCFRWDLADELLGGRPAVDDVEGRLQKNYIAFANAIPDKGFRPLNGELGKGTIRSIALPTQQVLDGFYPNGMDVRVAFHLCIASTGWNPQVMLDLDVDEDFLVPHPKDPLRYLLYGHKSRGNTEQMTEGLYRSRGSAGVILKTLIERGKVLRAHLRHMLKQAREDYGMRRANGAGHETLIELAEKILKYEEGVCSPWLFVNVNKFEVSWLSGESYRRGADNLQPFLRRIADDINKRQSTVKQISYMRASDFRDAFAGYAYRASGGMILIVKKILGHKRLSTTVKYVDNNIANEESAQMYRGFSNAFFSELISTGRVDPTVIAKISRDGKISNAEREKLGEYRSLRRSRIGVGCKDPTRPGKKVDPHFTAYGEKPCVNHRCTLCSENAVIFEDSLPGLAKRVAELRWIKDSIPVATFVTSLFAEELENAEAALQLFEIEEVTRQITYWEEQIANGNHRVVDFDSE